VLERALKHRCASGSLGQSALLWAEARYHAALGSYDRVDKFIAPSRFMRDAVVGRLGAGRVVWIPNGIDTSRIDVSPEDEGYALFLGRLSHEKGLDTLLRAHAAGDEKWRLIVAGTGPLHDDLRTRFPRAEFTGHLAGEALKAKLRAAAVVVVPSEWHENAPISVLEAMAYGKPVVASRIGGLPELVRHERNGLLFEPKNAAELSRQVRTLLADRELRKRFGREARRIVDAEYSIQRHAATLLSLYESLMPMPDKVGAWR
jgi:glycosyltransferase involved in cell wall biosynthesis